MINTKEFNPENAYELAKLCKYSYNDDFPVEIKNSKYFQFFSVEETELLVYGDDFNLFLIFRGTDGLRDWLTNIKIRKESWLDWGEVHRGFKYALNRVRSEVEDYFKNILIPPQNIWVTGHSLGGALSLLLASYLVDKYTNLQVYTFGCPRVGNKRWAKKYESVLGDKTFRIVNGSDIVPRMPRMLLGYRHPANTQIYITNSDKLYTKENLVSFSYMLCDRVNGQFHNLWKADIIDDHNIDSYIEQLEKLYQKSAI